MSRLKQYGMRGWEKTSRGAMLIRARTTHPRKQFRKQLGRIVQLLPFRRLGPRPNPEPQTRLPINPGRNPSPRSRGHEIRSRAHHQHRFHGRPPSALPRNVRILGLESSTASSEQGVGGAVGTEAHHEQYAGVWAVSEQDDEGYAGEVSGCDRGRCAVGEDRESGGCCGGVYMAV